MNSPANWKELKGFFQWCQLQAFNHRPVHVVVTMVREEDGKVVVLENGESEFRVALVAGDDVTTFHVEHGRKIGSK